jgi:hypothetical protein
MPVLILSESERLWIWQTAKHSKSKYIDIKYHQVHHYIQEGKVEVGHIASEYQIADIFTKACWHRNTITSPCPIYGHTEFT